jgi:cytoskeleton protein RodZ
MINRRLRPTMLPEASTEAALDRIGRELRAARLARGEDLYDIADILRIRPLYLEALERGDLGPIPGRPYAFGFLKSYADYIGLDGRALVGELKDAAGILPAAPALAYRTPVDEGRSPAKLLGAVSILVAAGLYTGWYAFSSGQLDVADLPTDLGQAAALLVIGEDVRGRAASGDASDAAVTASSAEAGLSAVVVSTPSPSLDELRLSAPEAAAELVGEPAPSASDAASAQAAEPSPANAGAMLAALELEHPSPEASRVFGSADDGGRIVILARDSSWIQVRSQGQDFVRTRTLQPGDRLALPNRSDLSLWTGNAGGIDLVVDGRNLGAVGASGQVVRDLALDADAMLGRGAASR